ncbi:MAG: PAS domain S-box protein [Desulfobulbaceae bacterium]|nr:PAS domain S-box protein [Desulfobulbaceae bacterium]
MAFVHSLKFKIFAILLLTMGGLLAYQAFFIGPQIKDKQISDSIMMQTALSDQITTEFDNSFRLAINELEEIAKLPGINSPVQEIKDETISTMSRVTPFFNYFFLMDKDGSWLSFPKRPHLLGKSIPQKNMDWVNKTFAEQKTIFLNVVVATIGKLVSGFSTPLPSASGNSDRLLRGVFVISEENTLLATLKKIRIGVNGYAFLVSANGWVLAHPDIKQSTDQFTVYDYSKFAPVKEVILGRSGHLEYEYDNKIWLASYRPIKSTGWGIIVQQPVADIYGPVEKNMALINRFFMASFALCIFILVVGIRYTLTPLTELARSITKGNPLPPGRKYARDEVGQLAGMFHELFNKLRQSLEAQEKSSAELWEYKDHLEELVKERTTELQLESSDREQAEKALQASEEKLSLIVAQSPLAIISWDINFNVTSWNPAAEKIFGHSSKDALSKHADFIVPLTARKQVDKIWQNLLQMSGGTRSTNENVNQEDRTILCDWYNTPLLDSSNEIIGVLSIVDDVTQKAQMEKVLLKVKKLESLGMLAGGIAHDFNNILTGILGNINLCLFDKNIGDENRQRLMRAEKASQRATALTQQLLTFAKGDAPVKEVASLADVIIDSAGFVLHGDTVVCRYDITEDLWLVDIDKDQISRVIQNIVINASHSMLNGGIINIHCENFKNVAPGALPLPCDREFVKITINDSGIGMPTDVLDKIFDPYFTTKQEGSGLGLAISHSIITKHDGHISVESEPDQGTTFTIYLPAASREMRPENADQQADIQLTKKARVMVMDDDETVRDIAEAMLTEMGHETLIALDGSEAVRMYVEAAGTTEPVDIIIMDLTIPGGMGGEEAVQKILAFDPEAKVIVSSGYANNSIMASYKKYGFCGAIRKPYKLDELARVISKVRGAAEGGKD